MKPSIPAQPQAWARAALHQYVRRSAAQHFHAWHWRAQDEAALGLAREASRPLLLVANHSAWWDGFFALELSAAVGHAPYVMMERRQLAQYRFFARCGAFSIAHDTADRDLAYAATLLQAGNGVWIFPQGERKPPGVPLAIKSGAARVACLAAPTRIVPVALRYVFLAEERPEAFAWLGTPFEAAPGAEVGAVQAQMATALDGALERLDAAIAAGDRNGFQPLVTGSPSINKLGEAFAASLGLLPADRARNG